MKKRLSVFVCLMLSMVMTAGAVFAGTFSGEKDAYKSTYKQSYYGVDSEFCAHGESDVVYVTLENTATTSRYLSCYLYEYEANKGFTKQVQETKTVLSGIQINKEMPRRIDMYGYYYFAGTCRYSQYSGGVIDDYTYRGYQRQPIN